MALYTMGASKPVEVIPGGAPFVTFVRQGGPLGLTGSATWVHIPWNYRMANRTWLMEVRLVDPNFIHLKPANWLETALWGQRYRVSLSFNDIRARGMFPMYFEHRDRIVRLAEEPAQLLVDFNDSDHLKIDTMTPSAADRRLSQTRDKTEVVSLHLDRAEGLIPQTLSVQFGYFFGWQAWAPVLIPAVFFLLGNIAGPLITAAVKRVSRRLSARVHVGPEAPPLERGTVVSRETLSRIVPGQATYEQVLELCGPDREEHEQLAAPDRRVLVYRGRLLVPRRNRVFAWFATVSGWDVEQHEAEITLERNVVHDVQARVSRSRLSEPDGAER